MKGIIALALCLPSFCLSFYERPWFGSLGEVHFRPKYSYSFFDEINPSTNPSDNTLFQNLFGIDLETTIPSEWNWQLELEFANATPVSFTYRSSAIQITKLWLDDVSGDPVSLTTGFSYRDSSNQLRRAFLTPYHARSNFEIHSSIGKEYSYNCYWLFRTYGTFAVGQGNKGASWLRGDYNLWFNFWDSCQIRLFAESYWGLGSKPYVPTSEFNGWAEIEHQSIDVGGSFCYQFSFYGKLRMDYLYRIYASNYPEKVHCFILSYNFPFCPF